MSTRKQVKSLFYCMVFITLGGEHVAQAEKANAPIRILLLGDSTVEDSAPRAVVMGGQQGYERGGWRGSLIEETMPVESTPALPGGLVSRPQGLPLKVSREVPWLEAISTASSPLVYHLHAVSVKPSGHVLVQAGDRPFLVTGAYGAGRVVCLLGLPWGDPGPHATPFWEWDDWVPLLREVSW